MTNAQMFIPITKVDQRKRQIWGYAASEVEDHAGEIMDYDSSKPYWEKWSQDTFNRSGGKSLGNLRSMHKPVAAGRLIEFRPDDTNKGVWVGAEVVDDEEWKKVEAGVYTGFSVGGNYVKRWSAGNGKTRYTAAPVELSLVDAPCIPTATFQVIKADGLEETRQFAPTNGENILKAELPDAPEAIGPMPGMGTGVSVTVLPGQEKPLEVDPDNVPSGATLAGRHTGVEEIDGLQAALGKAAEAADELADTLKKAFDESQHPRGKGGKFTSKGGSSDPGSSGGGSKPLAKSKPQAQQAKNPQHYNANGKLKAGLTSGPKPGNISEDELIGGEWDYTPTENGGFWSATGEPEDGYDYVPDENGGHYTPLASSQAKPAPAPQAVPKQQDSKTAAKPAIHNFNLGDRVDFGPNGKGYITGRRGNYFLMSDKKPTSRDYENPNLSGAVHISTKGKVIGHHEDAPGNPSGWHEDNEQYGKADEPATLTKIKVKPPEARMVKVRPSRMVKVV